jgi:hypothetical protein
MWRPRTRATLSRKRAGGRPRMMAHPIESAIAAALIRARMQFRVAMNPLPILTSGTVLFDLRLFRRCPPTFDQSFTQEIYGAAMRHANEFAVQVLFSILEQFAHAVFI